jgi:methyl-accepting chemotaxis protein
MARFNQFTIRARLLILVGLFVAGLLVFGVIAYWTLTEVKVNGPYYQQIAQSQQLLAQVAPSRTLESYFLASEMLDDPDPRRLEALIEKSRTFRQEYESGYDQWKQKYPEGEIKRVRSTRAYPAATAFFDLRDREFIPALQRGDRAAARRVLSGPMNQEMNRNLDANDEVVRLAREENNRLEEQVATEISGRTRQLVIVSLVIVAVLMVAGFLIRRSITNALQEAIASLTSTTTQMGATIEEHERTAMNQSAAVSQTTATMDELDASFEQTSQVVKTAADTAHDSLSVANEGRQTVEQTLDGMMALKEKVGTIAEQILSLSEQTSQIGSITNLVSDLASQTNMLALNAAVEAARAGEHGKGFAVVAAEIRKLADQSRKSAERINSLVEEIQKATNATVMATEEGTKTVERGIQLAQKTVEAFDRVAVSSNEASEAAQQTLLSVPQQAAAAKQVLAAMESLSVGARETAGGIGQTREGMGTLRETARKLQAMI